MPSYRVFTWDHDLDDFILAFAGLSLWDLRWALRELYDQGYDYPTILVERE